jgi:hypothetical protein
MNQRDVAMRLDYTPLLAVQRELYRIPRGPARFQEYLRLLLNEERTAPRLPPLGIINPMAREHVAVLLDELLSLNVESLCAEAVEQAAAQVSECPGAFRIGLALADDLLGGWTNRFACEFNIRFSEKSSVSFQWMSGVLWSSEAASVEVAREALLSSIHRFDYRRIHQPPRTLRDRMKQEGQVMSRAGCRGPALDPDDLAYTREVIKPFLDEKDHRVNLECLFGDRAARSLGFTPRGLSDWAGLALALHDAQAAS